MSDQTLQTRILAELSAIKLTINGDGGDENIGLVRKMDSVRAELRSVRGILKWVLCTSLTAGAYALADRLIGSQPPAAARVQAVDAASSLLAPPSRMAATRPAGN